MQRARFYRATGVACANYVKIMLVDVVTILMCPFSRRLSRNGGGLGAVVETKCGLQPFHLNNLLRPKLGTLLFG